MGDVRRLLRVGGHVAVDFVNTLGGLPQQPDDEYLHGYADLLAWCRASGLLDRADAESLDHAAERQPRRAATAFDRTLDLRAALDRVLRAHLDQQPGGPADRATIRGSYTEGIDRAELTADGPRYAWSWPEQPPHLHLPRWLLAEQAVDLLRNAPLPRLRRCAHCRWLFLDTSHTGTRRWCSMRTCGAIVKMRRYRQTRQSSPR